MNSAGLRGTGRWYLDAQPTWGFSGKPNLISKKNEVYPLSENPLILKGQMGKPGFWASFGKIKVFHGKNLVFHLHPLFLHFSQAKCRMFEEQSKGAGSRAGVERTRQVSFTAKLYIGFLDVILESLVSFCTAKCAIAPCSSRLELKRQG